MAHLMPRRGWLPVAGAAGTALALALWRPALPAAFATAIYPTSGPSDLDLVRPVLPDLDGLRSAGYATTFGETSLLSWMVRERCRCRFKVERLLITPASREEARTLMAARLASSQAPAFVIIDAPAGPYELPDPGLTYGRTAGIVDAVAAQDRYARVAVHVVPQFGAEVSLWRLPDAPHR